VDAATPRAAASPLPPLDPTIRNLTFEISLKPFYALDDDATLATCATAIRQWEHLARHATTLSILLWASDGSEILEYTGDLDAPMEWARYLGNSNPHREVPNDPEKRSLHSRNYLYRPDARPITYRRLADIARAWRLAAAGNSATKNKTLRIGLPFDPGGEFAPSDFKYKRHREICLANTMGAASFVCCYGILNSDTHRYAAYPGGIPRATGIGAFLGRQFRHLAADLGLDYLWLSNGFGFGLETWHTTGPLFDGRIFSPENAPALRDRILAFWRDLRAELPPAIGIETRGTNLGTATDLASDATPLRELYEGGFGFAPPPNSPWAALDGDFGIELAGYMTRVAELPPGRGIPFRYYLHDPWWYNSPWLDRYEGQPHDIYLPLATASIDATGNTRAAETLNLLTLDDSYGRMAGGGELFAGGLGEVDVADLQDVVPGDGAESGLQKGVIVTGGAGFDEDGASGGDEVDVAAVHVVVKIGVVSSAYPESGCVVPPTAAPVDMRGDGVAGPGRGFGGQGGGEGARDDPVDRVVHVRVLEDNPEGFAAAKEDGHVGIDAGEVAQGAASAITGVEGVEDVVGRLEVMDVPDGIIFEEGMGDKALITGEGGHAGGGEKGADGDAGIV
jgi:hypothetical protein